MILRWLRNFYSFACSVVFHTPWTCYWAWRFTASSVVVAFTLAHTVAQVNPQINARDILELRRGQEAIHAAMTVNQEAIRTQDKLFALEKQRIDALVTQSLKHTEAIEGINNKLTVLQTTHEVIVDGNESTQDQLWLAIFIVLIVGDRQLLLKYLRRFAPSTVLTLSSLANSIGQTIKKL